MEEEIVRVFAKEGFSFDNSDTIQQCISLCSSFAMNFSQLAEAWEVFYLNTQLEGGKVLNSQIDKFRIYLQTQQRSAFVREHGDMYLYGRNDVDMYSASDPMDMDSATLITPNKEPAPQLIASKTPARPTPRQVFSPTTPFSQRTTKCSVQFVFNEHVNDTSQSGTTDTEQLEELVLRKLRDIRRCATEVLSSGSQPGCRYMADQVGSRFNELERRIKKFAKAFSDYEAQQVSQHLAYASQEKVLVVGRVGYDAEEGDPNVVLLEGSVEYSGGHRVRLDLREVSQFSLFPGQTLVVEGHNPSGHCLVATRIIDSIPLPPLSLLASLSRATKRRATDESQSHTSDTLSIIVAAGPFTTSDNLAFEPLVELLSYARKQRPNVLLLLGPFIDSEHPHIKQQTADRLLSHIFQEEVRNPIEEYCEVSGEGARVMLVPSTRDAFHDSMFPQPPFDDSIFEDPSQQITLLPNPCVVRLDEVTVGCCTTDILKHLTREEISRIPAGMSSDRMTRLGAHIIGQRSFYPMFPPAIGTNLDASVNPSALDLPCTPDILVLPSELVPLVKPISYVPGTKTEYADKCTTLLVNPGRLAKGTMGGTFVEIFVASEEQSTAVNGHRSSQVEGQGSTEVNGVPGRTKVSFIKI